MILLSSGRLVIRRFAKHDRHRLREIGLAYEASEMAMYDHGPWPDDLEFYDRLIQEWSSSSDTLAVALKGSSELVGLVSLTRQENGECEIGYNFHPDSRGLGYATEACRVILEFLFDERGAERVNAGTAKANVQSRKVLERLGFQLVGERVLSFRKDDTGNPISFVGLDFVLTKSAWLRRNQPKTS